MSATRAVPWETDGATVKNLPIMPGPLGLDSPSVPEKPDQLPLSRWHAWFDLLADRVAGRTSPRHVVEDALGKPIYDAWGLWWLTRHVDTGHQLLHRARLMIVADGAEMLLAACRLSLPWVGPSDNVVPRRDAPKPPDSLVLCVLCAENDPADPTQPAHEWKGANRG